MPTAILVDGGFFIKRYRNIYRSSNDNNPLAVARNLHQLCLAHLYQKKDERHNLYRIFYYDCPPLTKKIHHPLTGRPIDFSKTNESKFRNDFHNELRKLRKVALRFGHLLDRKQWQINSKEKMKALLQGSITISDFNEEEITYQTNQKGVDMKIGIDIASLAYKKQVDQIVLIAGDSDFVPAAKLARREGIDFILDPMWNPIRPDLHEHIDGLMSTCRKPSSLLTNSPQQRLNIAEQHTI